MKYAKYMPNPNPRMYNTHAYVPSDLMQNLPAIYKR